MANSEQVSVSFTIEFHQSIRVANVFLTISNPENITDILVTKRYIQLIIRDSDRKKKLRQCRFCMSSDTFLPASTSGLSGQYFRSSERNDPDCVTFKAKPWSEIGPLELTFRIHVNDDVFLEDNCDGVKSFPTQVLPPVKIQTEYDFLCRSCKNPLNSSPLVFKRVLEKPSSDWQDLASEWFCHRHGDDDSTSGGICLTDLMFSNNCIFLHPNLINFKDSQNKSALCSRCQSHLGFLCESRLLHEAKPVLFSELMMNSIVLKPCDEILVEEEYETKSATETVAKLIRDQMEPIMMCKLCLESKGPTESGGSLLLWVMDNALLRFHTRCTLTSDLQTINIDPEKVIRVLYSVTEESSPLALKWRKDFSVDTQPLDNETLWEVVDHLLESSWTLPTAHRFLDDLWVGYLPQTPLTAA